MKIVLLGIAALIFSQISFAEEACTPVLKITKYQAQKGDHIAQILRKLELEPVFNEVGKQEGSLSRLLKKNKIRNPDLIEPNDEIVIPFTCEEQVRDWYTIDKVSGDLEYRLITLKKIGDKVDVVTSPEPSLVTAPKLPDVGPMPPQNSISSEDQKLNDLLKPDGTSFDPQTPDVENKNTDEISEALRYRMICEGEWTGTQCVTRYSTLYAAFAGWYGRYDGTDPTAPDGTDNKGILLSRLNPQVQVGWHNYWSENFKTDLSASVLNNEILPEAREIPIEQDKKILSSIYIQGRYEKGAFGVGVGIRNYDKLYYRFRFSGLSTPCLSNTSSFAGCGVFVHTANIMSYFANVNWMFYQQGKFSYDAKINFAYLGEGATGGFQVYSGFGTDIEFTVKHDRVREYLYGTLHYGVSSQNTSIEIQTAQELGFVFGYAWKLKDW